ncbi:MAG: hypothetical protein IPI28_03390 [Candidatus Omnitrophica bacterium]|nr:hypothetical protein [Candidatus Omnitrophota bacterium]
MKPATIEEECQRSLINNRLETLSEEIADLRDIIVLKANDTSRASDHILPAIAGRLDEIEAELQRHWQTAIRIGVTTTER